MWSALHHGAFHEFHMLDRNPLWHAQQVSKISRVGDEYPETIGRLGGVDKSRSCVLLQLAVLIHFTRRIIMILKSYHVKNIRCYRFSPVSSGERENFYILLIYIFYIILY